MVIMFVFIGKRASWVARLFSVWGGGGVAGSVVAAEKSRLVLLLFFIANVLVDNSIINPVAKCKSISSPRQ